MSPSSLPLVRRPIRSNRFADLEDMAGEALALGTPDEVRTLAGPLLD